MNEHADALRQRLEADPDADLTTLKVTTDRALAVGHDVWRLQWRAEATTAVAGDANLHTTCGALLDALVMIDAASPDPAADRSVVNVLVDRLLPGEAPTETDRPRLSSPTRWSGRRLPRLVSLRRCRGRPARASRCLTRT